MPGTEMHDQMSKGRLPARERAWPTQSGHQCQHRVPVHLTPRPHDGGLLTAAVLLDDGDIVSGQSKGLCVADREGKKNTSGDPPPRLLSGTATSAKAVVSRVARTFLSSAAARAEWVQAGRRHAKTMVAVAGTIIGPAGID